MRKGWQANSMKILVLALFKNVEDYYFFATDTNVRLDLSSYYMVPPTFCTVHLMYVLSPFWVDLLEGGDWILLLFVFPGLTTGPRIQKLLKRLLNKWINRSFSNLPQEKYLQT